MDRFRKNKKNTPSSNQKTSSKQRRPKASKSPKNSKVALKGQKMQDLGHVDNSLCQPNSPTIVPVSPNKWGLIRVHLGDIIPETVYKTVLVTPETTTNEVLKNVVETVNGLPPNMTVNDFCLQEAQDGPQGSYYRVLGASECPWLVHSKWDGTSGWSFRLSWRSKQVEDRMKTPLSTRRALSPTPISIHMDPNSREGAFDNGSTRGRSSSLALTPRNLVRSGCCDLDEDECNANGGERNSIARALIERFFHSNATEGKPPPGASLSTLTPEQWQRYLEISTSISSPERQLPSVRRDSSVIEEPADLECVFEEASMMTKPADSPSCSSSHDYAQFSKSHPIVPRNSPVCQGLKPTSDSKDQFLKSVTMPFVTKRQKCSNSAKRRLVKSSHICRDFAISESESVRKQQTETEPHVPEPEDIQKDNQVEQSGGILPSTPPSSKLTHSSSCPSFQEKWQVLNAEISVALETGISGVMNRVISEMGQSPLPIKVRRWHSLKTPDAKPLLFTKHVIPHLTTLGSASSELEEEEEVIIEPNILVKRDSTAVDHTMQNNETNANTSNLDKNRCMTDDDHTLDDSVFSPLESEMSKVSDIPSTDEGISSPSPLFSSTYCSTSGRDHPTTSTAPGTETKPVEYEEDFASMSFNDGFSSTDVSANSSRMGYRDNQQPQDDCHSNSEAMVSPEVVKMQMSSDIKEAITEGEIPIALDDERIAQMWTKLEEDGHQMKGNLPILMELTVMPSKAPDYLNVKGLRPASDIFQRPLSKVLLEATEYLGDDDKQPQDRECGDHDNNRTASKNLTGSGEASLLDSHSHASSPSGSTNTNASNNCDIVHTHGLSDPSSSPISTELVLGIENSEEDTRIHHHLVEGRFLGQFCSQDGSIDVDDVSIMVKIEEDVHSMTINDQHSAIKDVDHLQQNTPEVGGATANQTTPPKVAIELPPRVEEVQRHQQHPISHQQGQPLTDENSSATDSATLQPKLELVRFSSPLQNQRKGSLSKQDLDVDADFLLWEGSDYGFIDDEDEILPPLPVTPNSPVTSCATPSVNRAVCQEEQIERTNSYRKLEEREDFLDDFSSETSTSDSGDDVPLNHFDFEDDDEDWLESSLEDEYRSNLEEYNYMRRGQMSSTKVLVDLASEYGKGKYHFPFLAVIEEDPAEEQEERDYLALHESLWKTEMQEFEEMEKLVEVMVNEERELHTPETVIEVSSNDGSMGMHHHGNGATTMQEQVPSKVHHHPTKSGNYKLMEAPITQSSLEQHQLTTTTTTTTAITTKATTKNVGKEIVSSPVQKLASLDAESKCKSSPVKPRDRALKNVSIADIKKRLMKSVTTEEDEPKQITPHRGSVKNTGSTTVTTVYEPTGEVTKSGQELSDPSPGRRAGSNKKDKVKLGWNSEITVEGNQGEGNLVGKPLKPDTTPSPPLFKSRGSSPLTCSEKSLTPPLGEHIYRKSPDTSLRISNLFSGTRRPATSNKVKALSMKFDKAS